MSYFAHWAARGSRVAWRISSSESVKCHFSKCRFSAELERLEKASPSWGAASKNKSKKPWASIFTLLPCGNRCRFSKSGFLFRRCTHHRKSNWTKFQSRVVPANQRKGQNEKFMNFAHFYEFWRFFLRKTSTIHIWNFCSGMPLWKVHELTFLWFGLPGQGHSWLWWPPAVERSDFRIYLWL